jgi:DNA-binding NarL/FixJ family response regulator
VADLKGHAATRVVLVDDHPLLRAGVRNILERADDMQVVGEASCAAEAVTLLGYLEPQVVLLDISLPDGDGISLIPQIRAASRNTRVVMLTCQADEVSVRQAVDAGASGYVTKMTGPHELLDSVRAACRGQVAISPDVATHLVSAIRGQRRNGEPSLTEREREVWRALSEGLSNADIARRLFISEHTVKFHVHHLLGKLGLKNRSEAICAAHRRGMTTEPATRT